MQDIKTMDIVQFHNLLGIKQEARRLSKYLKKGRRWSAISGDDLRDRYLKTMRIYASDIHNIRIRDELDALRSELALRGEKVPDEMLLAEWKFICEALMASLETLSSQELDQLNKVMNESVYSVLESQN